MSSLSSLSNHKSCDISMGVLSIIIATFLLAHVEVISSDCGKHHQQLLKDLISSSESCDAAGYHDCCQVSVHYTTCVLLGK